MRSNFNGDRLRTARTYRSMTLAELGDSIDLSKQTLSLYENNRGTPDFSTIIKLSKILHFPTDYFFQKDNFTITSGSTYFRSLTTTTKKSRSAEITKVEFIGGLYETLYNYIDFPSLNLPLINIDNRNIGDFEIEQIASQIRDGWNLGNGPIKDLQYIFEENGIIVVGSKVTDRKIDAYSQLLTVDNNETYIIVLSVGKKGKARINFDLAHELGHIILHPWTEDIETLSNEEFKERERQANKFASSFLLPKDSFATDAEKFPTELEYYLRLKNKWGCSIQAMLYRSNDLGIITNNQFQYLMRQVSQKGWRTKEPGDFPHSLNENIFKMAVDLLLENNYTKKDIMEIFNKASVSLFSDEIEELLNLPKGYLSSKENKESKVIKLKINKDN
ncbi:MAG TPA: XRE family transcriptional regulator [Candidatus Eisenbacteria bacterium]|jgi:Zn-dependent peptidase ImmA (M78 family)/transcriptional regulator with XRE-family HTH domain|nr:XRE family transcriptional regulator [Candidatus Eisenbacteria bacterium]